MTHFLLVLSLLANFIAPPALAATLETNSVQQAFQSSAATTVWPVIGTSMKD